MQQGKDIDPVRMELSKSFKWWAFDGATGAQRWKTTAQEYHHDLQALAQARSTSVVCVPLSCLPFVFPPSPCSTSDFLLWPKKGFVCAILRGCCESVWRSVRKDDGAGVPPQPAGPCAGMVCCLCWIAMIM